MNNKILYPIGMIVFASYSGGTALFVSQFFPSDLYILALIVGLIVYVTLPAITFKLSEKSYDDRNLLQDALIYTGVAHMAFLSSFCIFKIAEHFSIHSPWSLLICFLFFLMEFFFLILSLE